MKFSQILILKSGLLIYKSILISVNYGKISIIIFERIDSYEKGDKGD